MRYCPKCGHQVAEEARTCPGCGYPLNTPKIIRENWADVLGRIGLGLSIFSFVASLFAFIPVIGVIIFGILLTISIIDIIFGIACVIKAVSKGKGIAAIIFSVIAIIIISVAYAIITLPQQ